MTKLYLLVIPVLIGIVAGVLVLVVIMPEHDYNDSSRLLLASKLINGGSPIIGNPNAPLTILEWGDYQCTFCYKFHKDTLDTIIDNYVKTNQIKFVFKDFPLNGQDSALAAEATFCANDQDKYWEYHDELYNNWGGENTGWITRDSLSKFATLAGVTNLTEFNKCLDVQKHKDKVTQLHEFGKNVGIDATPSFLVFNDEEIIKIRGNQPLNVFLETINDLQT